MCRAKMAGAQVTTRLWQAEGLYAPGVCCTRNPLFWPSPSEIVVVWACLVRLYVMNPVLLASLYGGCRHVMTRVNDARSMHRYKPGLVSFIKRTYPFVGEAYPKEYDISWRSSALLYCPVPLYSPCQWYTLQPMIMPPLLRPPQRL